MQPSNMGPPSTILDSLHLPQAQHQSKFYLIYLTSCKENFIGMMVGNYLYFKTTLSLQIGMRPHLSGHSEKKIKGQSGPPVQYGQEIYSTETRSSESPSPADPQQVGENRLGS